MTILAACAKPLTRLMAIASRGYTARKQSPDTYGPATTAMPWLRPDGGLPLPSRRIALLLETRRARDLRQSKLTAALEKDLRAVTHQMLAIHLSRGR